MDTMAPGTDANANAIAMARLHLRMFRAYQQYDPKRTSEPQRAMARLLVASPLPEVCEMAAQMGLRVTA